jgi:hypothetical protein
LLLITGKHWKIWKKDKLGFFPIFHIFSLFNLHFFHIFPIFSLFNLLFFCIFQIISQFSTYFFSGYGKYGRKVSRIVIRYVSEANINSYDISFMYKLPWYNCNIVECGIKHHKPNPLFTKTYNTDICLPLAGKYILKPCSGSKFSYCSKNRTLC